LATVVLVVDVVLVVSRMVVVVVVLVVVEVVVDVSGVVVDVDVDELDDGVVDVGSGSVVGEVVGVVGGVDVVGFVGGAVVGSVVDVVGPGGAVVEVVGDGSAEAVGKVVVGCVGVAAGVFVGGGSDGPLAEVFGHGEAAFAAVPNPTRARLAAIAATTTSGTRGRRLIQHAAQPRRMTMAAATAVGSVPMPVTGSEHSFIASAARQATSDSWRSTRRSSADVAIHRHVNRSPSNSQVSFSGGAAVTRGVAATESVRVWGIGIGSSSCVLSSACVSSVETSVRSLELGVRARRHVRCVLPSTHHPAQRQGVGECRHPAGRVADHTPTIGGHGSRSR
jgi:hypothetical protein